MALSGTVSVNASRGVAKFGNVSLRTSGAYTLQAIDGVLNAASSSFNVTPAVAKKLVFAQQPTAAPPKRLSPQPSWSISEDSFGNVVTTNSSPVTLSIRSGPRSGDSGRHYIRRHIVADGCILHAQGR